jgi:hypothetical protein
MANKAPGDEIRDDERLTMWRAVSGPHAELTGPLIRFAGMVEEVARARECESLALRSALAARTELGRELRQVATAYIWTGEVEFVGDLLQRAADAIDGRDAPANPARRYIAGTTSRS